MNTVTNRPQQAHGYGFNICLAQLIKYLSNSCFIQRPVNLAAGGDPLRHFEGQPNPARHIAKAKKRGAKVVAIDVRMSDACRSAHERFVVKPGTDAALALAMMHVIITEDLFDPGFVAAHTVGFDALRDHVDAYTPAWAAGICGVDADSISTFAREYAATKRAMILIGGASMHKDAHGWEAARAISCLPALTGKIGYEGAGFGPRHAGLTAGYGFSDITNYGARPPGNYIPTQMSAILEAMAR